jgi:hypothetical protein
MLKPLSMAMNKNMITFKVYPRQACTYLLWTMLKVEDDGDV